MFLHALLSLQFHSMYQLIMLFLHQLLVLQEHQFYLYRRATVMVQPLQDSWHGEGAPECRLRGRVITQLC